MAPSVILGYWNARGLGEPIRYLLEYAGQEFEDRRYDFGSSDPNEAEKIREKWISDKTTLPEIVGGKGETAMDFPNLPYYIEVRPDGSKLKLTQSLTILRHLARKFDLVVENRDDQTTLELYEQQLHDIRSHAVGYAYNSSMVMPRFPNYKEDCKEILGQFEHILHGKTWLMGSKLTYVDFLLFEVLEWHMALTKNEVLKDLPELRAFHQRFAELKPIKAYMTSNRFHSWPFTSPFAKNFGYFK